MSTIRTSVCRGQPRRQGQQRVVGVGGIESMPHQQSEFGPVGEVGAELQGLHAQVAARRDVPGVLGDGQTVGKPGVAAQPAQGDLVDVSIGLGHPGVGGQRHVPFDGLEEAPQAQPVEFVQVVGEDRRHPGGSRRGRHREVGHQGGVERRTRRGGEPPDRRQRLRHIGERPRTVGEGVAEVEQHDLDHRPIVRGWAAAPAGSASRAPVSIGPAR